MQHGAVGAWILISSILVLQGGSLPAGLAWLGFVTAALALVTVVGYMALVADRPSGSSLLTIGIGVGTPAEAAWFIWLGFEVLN